MRRAASAAQEPETLAQELIAADAAIDQQPEAPAPHLARALALEKMGLLDAAAQEFDRWARLESDETMLAEMAERRASLHRVSLDEQWSRVIPALRSAAAGGDSAAVSAIIGRYPQQARTYAEGPFLTEWADAHDRRARADAATALSLVRTVAGALQQLQNDHFLSDAIAAIEHAAPAQQTRLAAAQKQYDAGRRLLARRDAAAAIPLLEQARAGFETVGSPMALTAAQFHAVAINDTNDLARARQLVEQVQRLVPERYPARRAEVAWLHGTIIGSGGALYTALVSYREAERTFARLGESGLAATLSDLAAHVLVRLGRDGEAARLRHAAFQRASANGDLGAIESMLTQAASDAYYTSQFDLARSYYRLALDCRVTPPNRRRRVLNLLGSALSETRAGNMERAATELARASATALALPDPLRESALHDVATVRALVKRERDPATAHALLSDVIEFARRNKPIHVPRLLVERARAARLLGRGDDAARDLSDAIDAIEARRLQIALDELRDTFLGSSLDAYDELYDLAEAAGDYERAFETAERQRGRIFRERFEGAGESSPHTMQAIADALEEDTTIVHYTALSDRVVIFAMSSRGARHARVMIAKDRLMREIDQFRAALRDAKTALRLAPSTTLANILLGPIADSIETAEKLVIVPDEIIGTVPFAALAGGDGRYAAERWILGVSSSAAEYLRSTSAATTTILRPRACVVGDPAFDETRYAELPRLPGATREAKRIARLYGTTPLTGADATRSAFESGFRNSDVMHVATHAVLHQAQPERSAIVLSDGDLTIADIGKHPAHVAGIVVLAGCRTAVRARRNELSSLTNAFLAAGSRSVIATLWDLPDGQAHRLVLALHARIIAGERPAYALAMSQRELIQAGTPPSAWSAFQLYGSY